MNALHSRAFGEDTLATAVRWVGLRFAVYIAAAVFGVAAFGVVSAIYFTAFAPPVEVTSEPVATPLAVPRLPVPASAPGTSQAPIAGWEGIPLAELIKSLKDETVVGTKVFLPNDKEFGEVSDVLFGSSGVPRYLIVKALPDGVPTLVDVPVSLSQIKLVSHAGELAATSVLDRKFVVTDAYLIERWKAATSPQ